MCSALVADYGSDSSDNEDEAESASQTRVLSQLEVPVSAKDEVVTPLASASQILEEAIHGKSASVFANPFLEAENKQLSVLERHVQMTNTKEPQKQVDQKVCWKFLKGHCKHGKKCKYSHPASSPLTHRNSSVPKVSENSNSCNTEMPEDSEENLKKKKRCGITNTLQPPKKFMKIYNKHKASA